MKGDVAFLVRSNPDQNYGLAWRPQSFRLTPQYMSNIAQGAPTGPFVIQGDRP